MQVFLLLIEKQNSAIIAQDDNEYKTTFFITRKLAL